MVDNTSNTYSKLHNFEFANDTELQEYNAYRYSLVYTPQSSDSRYRQDEVNELRKITVQRILEYLPGILGDFNFINLGDNIYRFDLCNLTKDFTPSIFISLDSQIILINNAIRNLSKEIKSIEDKLNDFLEVKTSFLLSINAILNEDYFLSEILNWKGIKNITLILQSPNFLNLNTKLKLLHHALNNTCTVITYKNRFGRIRTTKDFIDLIKDELDYIRTGAGKIIINTKDEEIDSNDYPVKTTISEKDNIDEVKEAFYKVDKRDSSGIYATT